MKKILIGIVALLLVIVAVVTVIPRGEENEVLVLCGGSMRVALNECIQRYKKESDTPVLATFGGSGELCMQIQKSGKGDIFLCHDPFILWAEKQGLISEWKTMGSLDVVIVVPKDNPKGIKELKDLAKPGVRLGIGDQTFSTSGHVVKAIMRKVQYGEDILKNVRAETKGHQARCNDVKLGALDAGIVWNAVAHQFKDDLEIIEIPKEYVDAVSSATYKESDLKNVKVTVGIITASKDKKNVNDFYAFITQKCSDIFEKNGFSVKPE